MRRAAPPELNIPPARLVDLPNWVPGPFSVVPEIGVGTIVPVG